MKAEYNYWSVTIYADGDKDIPALRRIMDVTKMHKIVCGSVGVIPLPEDCKEKRIFTFVSLLHCDLLEAKMLLQLADVHPDSVPFKEAEFEEKK